MSIKIIANNLELDYVKETLTIKNENNSLSRDFKVSASSFPFLIVENKNTKQALGSRDLSSVNKKKTIEVVVLEGDNKYYGQLQILTYLNGFRKCNLKYSSVILSIMSRKISDFLPIVSIIPDETDPVPFTEKSDSPIVGSQYWKNYPMPFLDKVYPEVKWQFPTMKWLNKFGVNLESDDPWFLYKDEINDYDSEGLIENYYTILSDVCTVYNKNVVSPQIFLLSPAFYALESLGFALKGNFADSSFIKSLLLYSNKNNLTETNPVKETESINLSPLQSGTQYNDEGEVIYSFFFRNIQVPTVVAGKYIFEYEFNEPEYTYEEGKIPQKLFTLFLASDPIYVVFRHLPGDTGQIYKGSVTIDVSEDQVGTPIHVNYYTPINALPVYNINKTMSYGTTYYQMHPTIQLGRYVPDWTFGTYLNELQNLFNLEIVPDDFSKTLTINFNEETIKNSVTHIINKSLLLTSYDPPPFDSFLLKYDNDDDDSLWITAGSVEMYNNQKSDFSETLSSKFKYIKVTYTANLSDDLDSKNGTGLMIYDVSNKPYISSDLLGQTLSLDGAKGICSTYWKTFLKFLLNSSVVEITGPFTETDKGKILRSKRIFVDNQEYLIASTDITETKENNFKIKFNLRTVTF